MPRAGWLAVGAFGGALASIVSEPAFLVVAAGVAFSSATLAAAIRRWKAAAVAVAAAAVLARAAAGAAVAPHFGDSGDVPRGSDEHAAVVVSLGALGGGQQRAIVELLPPDPSERVYVWLPRYPAIAPTDRITFRGELEPAPGEGGFGEFLARSGIRSTSRARSMERIGADDTPLAALEQLRRAAGEAMARALPEPQAGLSSAMLIGLRDLVSREVSDAFRASGLSHVVAISGWHIAMLGAMVASLLGGMARRPRSVLILLAITGYAVLAGGSPSVVRAAVMASVVLLARESGRRGTAAAGLALAAAGMLLVDPQTVEDVGFQLSVAATAGLLRWAGPLGEAIRPRLPAATPGWLLEALAVSLAAQVATLPLVLFHFGRLSLVAPLANLLVAPIVAPVMIATAVAVAAGALISIGVPAIALAPITLAGALGVGLMIGIAELSAAVPFANVELAPPLDVVSAGIAAAAVALALGRGGRPRARHQPGATDPLDRGRPAGRARTGIARPSIAVAAALGLVLALIAGSRPDGRLHLTVLDVGQGDAMLLQGPQGSRVLIDTGPDPDRLVALLDARIPAWDRRLDLVVVTHPHEDHVAGLALLLDRYRIGAVIEPGMIGPGPGDAAFRRRLADLGRETRVVAAGDRFAVDGVQMHVHWPVRGTVPLHPADTGTGINNVSIVLEVRYGERRFLLTGDVEEEIDPRLLAAGIGGTDGDAIDVLKVAHHGSGTATTDAFVERLRPRVAIVSAGWGNPYGHPSPATIARLEGAGARLFRTDLDGSVEVSTDGADLRAVADGGRPTPTRRPITAGSPGVGFCPIPPSAATRRRPYNRRNGRALPRRSRPDPARAPPARVATHPFERGGGRRGVPRRTGSSRQAGQRAPGGGGRAAA